MWAPAGALERRIAFSLSRDGGRSYRMEEVTQTAKMPEEVRGGRVGAFKGFFFHLVQ